jgi:hypothetical protein
VIIPNKRSKRDRRMTDAYREDSSKFRSARGLEGYHAVFDEESQLRRERKKEERRKQKALNRLGQLGD